MLKMIVAVGRHYEIGRGNELPWHCKEDLRLFKALTDGQTVIMGRNTASSLGKPLPGRKNVVLTRSRSNVLSNGFEFSRFPEVMKEHDDAWIIGGESIYKLFLPYVDEIYVSHIDLVVEDADAWFPFERMLRLGFTPHEETHHCSISTGFKQIVYRM